MGHLTGGIIVAKRIFMPVILALGFGLTGVDPAAAQSYPSRLIKIVVPYPPGGPSDVAARLVAQPLTVKLGQTVIIENLPGAGGRTGAKAVAQASPDGYTLLLGGTNPNAVAQSIYRSLNFEPIKDFAAVGVIGVDSNALVVNPVVPVNTIQELIQYSKANPGKLSSGATLGIGPHVTLELLRARTGSSMAFIPYRGAAPAISDLLGNQIQIGMTTKAVLLPPHQGRQAQSARRDQRRPVAGASGRAHDARKRVRRRPRLSVDRPARPGSNSCGSHRETQRRDE
jgi:tripartite-type tricarboxylate transporter receptor subunit TctC